jgi:hypothetical protein
MVLCDGVHRDDTTGKYTILGTFSTLGARHFPAKLQFVVYFAVTDGLGPTRLRLRLVDARCGLVNGGGEDEGVVFKVETEFDFENPLVVLELPISISAIIPKAGLYHCELWAGEDLLMSRRLLAAQAPDQEENDTGEDNE